VFALMGCGVCIQIQYMIQLIAGFHNLSSNEAFNQLLMVGIDTALTLAKCYEEHRLLQNGKCIGVDHAGHLDGFYVGVACYLALKVAGSKLRQRRSFGGSGYRLS